MFFTLGLSSIIYSQNTPIDSLASYIGKKITICEVVKSTFATSENKITYLNFGQPYPNATFTAVIFQKNLVNFSYSPSTFLKNKTICITGIVTSYKDKPQIVITNEAQINIKE